MARQDQAETRIYEILRGDQLGALAHAKPNLKENILSLWGTEIGINVSHENRYAVIFENEKRERIIGLAKLITIQTGKGVAIGIVHDVVVDEEFRGQGLGKGLVGLLIREGRDQRLKYLELTSKPAREAANGIYQKMGFKFVATACEDGTNLYRYIF